MKITVINGSPKGSKSNTLKLTNAFIEGIKRITDVEVQTVTIVDEDIKDCKGCFVCWCAKTAGSCAIKDDMEDVRKKIMWADLIIESFPVYFFGMPGPMKRFTDRCLPFTYAYLGTSAKGKQGKLHEMYPEIEKKKLVVFTTCGYTETDVIYDSLIKEYDLICGDGYTFVSCPQGELFGKEAFNEIAGAKLGKVSVAGEEFARNGVLSDETIESIKKPMIPQRAFAMVLDKYFNGDGNN